MNSTLELLNNRMSLRKYADKPIDEQELDIILQGAMRAPTAGNMMLYSILVIKDEEKKKRLSETCDNQPFIATAPVVLIFLADIERTYDYFKHCKVEEMCKERKIEYREPGSASLFLAASDALIAAQNAVIAAESIGVGSCYIGDIVENYEIHKEMFNLPNKVFPIGMLCLGHYPEDMKRRINTRHDKKYIVFDEEYKHLTGEEFNDMYDRLERKLPKDNKFGAKNIGQIMYLRKFGSEFFREMERSIELIYKHWKGNEK